MDTPPPRNARKKLVFTPDQSAPPTPPATPKIKRRTPDTPSSGGYGTEPVTPSPIKPPKRYRYTNAQVMSLIDAVESFYYGIGSGEENAINYDKKREELAQAFAERGIPRQLSYNFMPFMMTCDGIKSDGRYWIRQTIELLLKTYD